jgi:hypothetical protein
VAAVVVEYQEYLANLLIKEVTKMPTQEEAKLIYDAIKKNGKYYDRLNDTGKKAYWQYMNDQQLIKIDKLNDKGKAEYQKYVDINKPEYAMQASIVEKPKQYIQTQNEKVMYAITPGIVKNMASKSPEQIAIKRIESSTADKRRLLNERMIAETDTQTTTGKSGIAKVPTSKTNMIPVGKAGIVKTPAREFNGIDAALLGALDTTTLGALNIKDDAAIKENKGAFTAGQVAGYIAPGTGLTNAAGKGLAKLGAGKLLQNLGGSAIAGATIDTGQGLVAGDTGSDLAKRVGRGAVIGLAADGALMGLGKIGQGIMKKLADKQTLSAAEKAVIDNLPEEAKKEVILYVDTYGNVRKTPATDLQIEAPKQNLPKVDGFKSLTKTVTPEIEVNVPKVIMKKERYIPSASDIIDNKKKPIAQAYKTPGLGGEPFGEGYYKNTYLKGQNYKGTHGDSSLYSATRPGMDSAKNLEGIRREREILEGQYKRVKNLSDVEYMDLAQRGYLTESDYRKYVEPRNRLYPHQKETILKNIKESKLEGRAKRESQLTFNEWYYRTRREEFDEFKYYYGTDYRKDLLINKDMGEDEAIKAVKKGERQDYKDFIEKAKKEEAIMYPKAKFNNTLLDSAQTQKIIQPPITKGQTLKPNKPIQSALDARLNKPQIAQGKNIETPFRLTPAELARTKAPINEVKPLGDINTQPIANKPPIGALKAQGEVVASIKPTSARTAKEAIEKATGKQDISGFQAYTTDVYRNFEKVFGEDFPAVKREILDKFDEAKKTKAIEDRQLMTDLKKNVVDKLGIGKKTPESALVQQFGEKRISYESLVDKVGKAKADKIVEADKWFRSEYDRLIDEVNAARAIVYPNQPDKLIPKRKDYYRHFKELSDDFAGLKNVFDTPSQISPSLAGTSEFTKPKSKFLSFAQKRGNGAFTDDAVGGFLDYINAATYAKHIDTQIPKFRALASDLQEATEQSKNMNNFIGYLTDFANDLSGKTNPADRFVQKIIPGGRTTFKAINWLNNRVKANTILGNLSSSLSQLANLPQGIAYVKNPVQLSKGAGNFMASIFGKGDAGLYKKSGFILERYSDSVARQFDTKILDQPKKAAAWMLGALDEVGTKTIWSSLYQKAIADGIENPIKYADDITRKLVAGRGIGEVPLLQKSKIMQLFAPFTIEVNNLWKVQKDFIKAKDFGGLALLYLANYVFNKGMEEVRGDGVVFDPIQAIYDATTEKDLKPVERVGRLGGEVLSNIPLGASLTETLYPEQGIMNEFVSLPTREKLFGRNDPTRFGSGLTVVKGIQDPLYKLLPSFGGGQIKKTIQAGQDLSLLPRVKKQEGKILPKLEKQDMTASYSNTMKGDRLRTTIDPTLPTTLKGLAFGRSAIPELKKYYEAGKVPFSTIQTDNFKTLVDKGYESNKLFNALNSIRGTTKKNDIVVKLRESGYNSREINEIWEIFYK